MNDIYIKKGLTDYEKLVATQCSSDKIYEMLLDDIKRVLLNSPLTHIYCRVTCPATFPFGEISNNVNVLNNIAVGYKNFLDIKFTPSLSVDGNICYYVIVAVCNE
jgi:hypothetical protein